VTLTFDFVTLNLVISLNCQLLSMNSTNETLLFDRFLIMYDLCIFTYIIFIFVFRCTHVRICLTYLLTRVVSAVAWSNSVPNFSEIDQSVAELLTIRQSFFVAFRYVCSQTRMCVSKVAWTDLQCTKFGENIGRSSVNPKYKKSSDSLFHFQTRAAQSRRSLKR